MKRSEMIKKLTGIYTNKDRRYEVNTELAELLLNTVELLGMVPPFNENWMCLDTCREYYGEDVDINEVERKNIHRWDSEDVIE